MLDELSLVRARQAVREHARRLGFGDLPLTRLVTAVSELARNALVHGGGGRLAIEELRDGPRAGLAVTVEDDGPGIPDLSQALHSGYSSNGGLGLGLGGARRLSRIFEIDTRPGRGTRVRIEHWG